MKKKYFLQIGFFFLAALQLAFINFSNFQTPELNLDGIKRISRACYLIQHEYYDPNRVKPREMLEEGFYELAKEVPEILPKFSGNELVFQVGTQKTTIDLSLTNKFYNILYPVSQAFDFLKKNYHGEAKWEDMEYAFISGMLAVLDPHSSMLPPKAYEEFKTQTSGQYGGLGIVIGLKDNELTVIAPLEDTPAWRAGIQPDDKILEIGDQSTANMDLSEAVDLMRGEPNTKVALKIKTKTDEPRIVTLMREVISIVSVQSKVLDHDGKKIGVLRVKGFQEDTYADVVKELEKMDAETKGGLTGIVIDLRNNPGGLLDQAILMADRFLSSGDIVFTQTADASDEDNASARNQAGDVKLPLAVLVNEGSASASEIVAGALKNNDRAVVIGRKSFGKGSVQSLFSLRDGSSLKLTVAQYLTPGRISIQAEGIVPDIHLYPSLIREDAFDLREDQEFNEGKLDAHLENISRPKESKPVYDLTFFKEEAQKPEQESQYTTKINEAEDFPLRFAVKMLASSPLTDKKALLAKTGALIEKESEEQDKLLVGALKKRGLNWEAGKNNIPAQIEFRHEFVGDKGEKIQSLIAGTTAKLKVTLRNDGKETLHRVLGEVESFNPLLNRKEFVFGKLSPGQEASAEIEIKVPAEVINFQEEAFLNIFTSETGEQAVKKSFMTAFAEKSLPHLAYSYIVFDGNREGSKGDGDGIPEKGEKITMEVIIRNLGPGISEKTMVNLQNTEGDHVFLEKARAAIGRLDENSEAKTELKFDIRESFTKPEFSIKFFALDDETKTVIADTLKFTSAPTALANPPAKQMQVTPRIEILASSAQKADKYKVAASILDDTKLKDVAIFVNGKKLYYDNLQGGAMGVKSKIIDVEVPLEDGLNPIVIQARGERDLINQKNLSIVYHDANKVAKGN